MINRMAGNNWVNYNVATIQPKEKEEQAISILDINGFRSFKVGDTIGVYPVAYKGKNPGSLGDLSNSMNQKFIYDGIYWRATSVKKLILTDTPIDIYAYSPYDEEIGWTAAKSDPNAYPFSVGGDQNLFNADLQWAKISKASSESGQAELVFKQLMSYVEIRIYSDIPQYCPAIFIHNTKTDCLADLSTGKLKLQNRMEPIKPRLVNKSIDGRTYSYKAILIPQKISQNNPYISLMNNYGESMTIPISHNSDFEQGRSYIINLDISNILNHAFHCAK